MPGLHFLFSAALWALPLAGLPVLLHLLFRRKSPVVPFPTLRFLRASVKQTAARRRVRRWLLLACRALLLALLIGAVAQPATRPAAGMTAGASSVAVIVVDTSYSMELQDAGSTLLARAEAAVRELLRSPFRDSRVAILRSSPAPEVRPEAEELRRQQAPRPSGEIQWTRLTPQPAARPLVDRVGVAIELLGRESAGEKWLVVISDFQQREFPRPMPAFDAGRTMLIVLRPDETSSAAVVGLTAVPEQPTPGIGGELLVDVIGRAGDARQVNVSIASLDGAARSELPPAPAVFDAAGRARLRFPLRLPPGGWARVEASTARPEPLAWARSRSLLLHAPPRQMVTVTAPPELAAVARRVALAMDPSEGRVAEWPLSVRLAPDIAPDASVAVVLSSEWPDAARAQRLLAFVRRGNTLIWFVRPGLEQTWATLDEPLRATLAQLLPGVPSPAGDGTADRSVAVAAPDDPALAGLTDDKFQMAAIGVERLLPFEKVAAGTTPLLNAVSARPGAAPLGLVFRRAVGAGTAFTFATLPQRGFSTIFRNPTFPPMLVQMALRPPGQGGAQNVTVGETLSIAGAASQLHGELHIANPSDEVTVVRPTTDADGGGRRYVFGHTETPGHYAWHPPAGGAALAVANAQPPAAEAELTYAAPVGGENVMVARSTSELQGRLDAASQLQPRWALPVGIVLVLLCVEALMSSVARRPTTAVAATRN